MVVVAIVGGTGGVGKTLVDAFKADGKHQTIVLARKVPEAGSAVPVFAVDYGNVEQLRKTLEENNVHTIISTIVMYDPSTAQAEKNMVAAAAQSSTTKRFVASNWGTSPPEDKSTWLAFNTFREQTLEVLRKTDLEWTQFHTGLFLDYYGMPHAPSYLTPLAFAVDMQNKTAAIPGATGEEIITFTYTKDLAKFVVAAQSVSEWPHALHCYSDYATWNQLIQFAEEATGSKFTVTFDPVEKLRSGEVTELPSHPGLYPYFPKQLLTELLSKFGQWAVNGNMYLPKEGSLNERFPEISTTTVREIVGAWKGK